MPTIVATARARALSVAGRRPNARPRDATTAMTAARATLGARPTRTLYARTQATRAIGARDREGGECHSQTDGQPDPGERRELHRESDADGARGGGKEWRPKNRGHRVVTMSFMSAKTRAVTRPRVCSSSIRTN